nr:MAG TPA: hypothetical protein [Caudoviricetes sp.]
MYIYCQIEFYIYSSLKVKTLQNHNIFICLFIWFICSDKKYGGLYSSTSCIAVSH